MPTLSHLLAVVLRPTTAMLSSDTSLLIIDGLNQLLDLDYPRYHFANANKSEAQKWQTGRRYAILGTLVTTLNKLAVQHNLVVLVSTGCATRMRADQGLGAALVPGIGGMEWESGIWNRLVLFRDFGVRFVGIQKCQGRSLISREEVGETGHIVPFDIASDGSITERSLVNAEREVLAQQKRLKSSPPKARKRHVDEIADSEGEDVDEFGWGETDEEVFAARGDVEEGVAVAAPVE